jgi:hypothetical protein
MEMVNLNSDYGIKLALLQEYKKVLEFKKMYEELVESFQYIVRDLFQYAEKNKVDLPHKDKIYQNIEKAQQLIEYRIVRSEQLQPTENQQRNQTLINQQNLNFTMFEYIS